MIGKLPGPDNSAAVSTGFGIWMNFWADSTVFLKFYEGQGAPWPCKIVCVEDPKNTHNVMEIFYNVHAKLKGDVRFIKDRNSVISCPASFT